LFDYWAFACGRTTLYLLAIPDWASSRKARPSGYGRQKDTT